MEFIMFYRGVHNWLAMGSIRLVLRKEERLHAVSSKETTEAHAEIRPNRVKSHIAGPERRGPYARRRQRSFRLIMHQYLSISRARCVCLRDVARLRGMATRQQQRRRAGPCPPAGSVRRAGGRRANNSGGWGDLEKAGSRSPDRRAAPKGAGAGHPRYGKRRPEKAGARAAAARAAAGPAGYGLQAPCRLHLRISPPHPHPQHARTHARTHAHRHRQTQVGVGMPPHKHTTPCPSFLLARMRLACACACARACVWAGGGGERGGRGAAGFAPRLRVGGWVGGWADGWVDAC